MRAECAVATIDDIVCVVGVVDNVPIATFVHPHEPAAEIEKSV